MRLSTLWRWWLVSLLVAGSGVRGVAASGPADRMSDQERAARVAQGLLDERLWAQVVRIENRRPNRRFPAATWATVFELQERLWIYVPGYGTRSLSLVEGRLAEDRADLTTVLRAMNENFGRFAVVVDDDASDRSFVPETMTEEALPKGCVVRSLAQWWTLQDTRHDLRDACLLFYYGGRGGNRWGHTVLCFATAAGWFYWDTQDAAVTDPIRGGMPSDALDAARRLAPPKAIAQLNSARRLELVPMADSVNPTLLAARMGASKDRS